MAKLLISIVAENLSHMVEQHQILPKNHFSGHPGRSTMDTVHYLEVVLVFFLNVEGAFLNAVPA